MSTKDMEKAKSSALIISAAAFYTIWYLYEFLGKPILDSLIENEVLLTFIKSGVIKNLVWTLPAALLIHHYRSEVCSTLKEMFTTKVKWLRYLPIFLIFTVYILTVSFLQKGELKIAESFGMDDIIILLFVGLTEEMLFRGWFLNVTFREDKKLFCVLINALMFMAIHFPTWIRDGIFISNFTSFAFIVLLGLSFIFSWTFIKSKSILVPISLHMWWDLLGFMLF